MKCILVVYLTGALLLGTIFMTPLTYAQSSAVVKAVVGFEKQIVNASEGNVALVCVTTLFISSPLSTSVTVNVLLLNFTNKSSVADMDDFDIGAISALSVSPLNKTQCLRISIIKDNLQEGLETFGLELESTDPAVFIFHHSMTVNILETCYNGEIRLRDGFDEYQGRVEVCHGGVWGTVCHNDWDKADAQVVCRQLGLLSIDTGAEAFSNAIFGAASYEFPVHFDRVECNGAEAQLVHCWHHDDTDNCLHSKDASVDCLGRSIVGAPCATETNIRLIGGLDEYQGRVEICTDGIYSSICHNRWDGMDAQVVCRQLNLLNSTGRAVGTTGSVFGMGVGSIVFTDINCLGNESSILNCSLSTTVDPNQGCIHFNEAGVDCLGREIRGASVSFEQLYQVNGQPLAIREGQSLQLCVMVKSGILPYEELFTILPLVSTDQCPPPRKERGISLETSSLDLDDFLIEYPLQQRQQIYLGPSLNRSCINITAIDDDYLEDEKEYLSLYLLEGDKSNAQVTNDVVQVVILDNDMSCRNGESVCVDTKTLTATCIPQQYVCDGINNCTDGSDESNCPDYCSISKKMNGFNCLSEKLCIPQDYVCDGIPDCIRDRTTFDESNCIPMLVNCTHGDIRTPLLGGVADYEGLVEVCVEGVYYPVSLDNGQFSVREATVICKQLRLGNVGMPLSASLSFGFQVQSFSRIAKIRCDKEGFGNSIEISSCQISLPSPIDQRQAGVRCFQLASCQDGEMRLVNDALDNNEEEQMTEGSANFLVDSNTTMANAAVEGRVEICFHNVWGAIFDQKFTNKDAAVVCHQLGYNRYGAIPSPFTYYGKTENVPFVLSSPLCNGYETSLLQCANNSNLPFGEVNQYRDQPDQERNTAGVICEEYETATCSHLDVRLTFRNASSSGLVEICNKEGMWSIIVTTNILSNNEKTVICRQLGFMNIFDSNSFTERISERLSDQREKFDEFLRCNGNENSLDECLPLIDLRKKRGLVDVKTSLSNLQVGLRCGAPLMIHFQPPSPNGTYTVEQHRKLNLSCFWDQNIYPPPYIFTNFTDVSCGNSFDAPLKKIINLFQTSEAILSDGGTFTCTACISGQIRIEKPVAIRVRVPEGLNESAYIRVSHISMERAISTSSIRLPSFTSLAEQVQNQILSSISTNFPGLHIVYNCTNVNRRRIETERRLNRLECVITQYREEDEEVLPVLHILQKAVVILERQLSPVLLFGINISVTGFCSREIVFGEGTKFDWPETIGGANATFLCPNNATVLRCCRIGGIWQEFDHGGCITDIGYEWLYQENGNPLAIREGHSLQICVVAFGNLPFQETFIVEPYYFQEQSRKKRGINVPAISFQTIAASDSDYVISYPSLGNEISLGPDMSRSCINITANDDTEEESSLELLVLRLSHDVKKFSSVQVIRDRSMLAINLLDDDIDCKDDERVCVDTEILSVACTKSKHVCDGINDCRDGSDELDCPDYCSISDIDGFNCLPEKFCVPQEHICDGFPDCVRATTVFDEMNCIPTADGCIDGDVRTPLLGGASKAEGMVEVCVNGTYLPVSLDNGRFSVREATAICNQLNFGNAGMPLNVAASFRFHVSISVSHMAKLRCNDTLEENANVSACTLSTSTLDKRPAGVRCFLTEPCEEGDIRLVSGNLIDFDQDQDHLNRDARNTEDEAQITSVEGRVEICFNNVWGAIYDENWTNKDAAVVCHQLGFSRSRAIPKPFTYYGETDYVPFVLRDPVCQGDEASILQCQNHSTLRFGEADRYRGEPEYALNMTGVQCEYNEPDRCSHLDVRLTFRSTIASGLLEICNEDGKWSIACSGAISTRTAAIICQQLDFSSENRLTEAVPVYTDQRPVIYDFPTCEGMDTSLQQCQLFNTDRNKRELTIDTCDFQTKLQCGVPPKIHFHPPSPKGLYTVEQQRGLNLSCFWDQNIYPPVALFTNSTGLARLGGRGAEFFNEFEEQRAQTTLNFLLETEAKPEDSGVYTCIAHNPEGDRTQNSLTVTVLEPEGHGDSAFIRVSYPSMHRASYTDSKKIVLTTEIQMQILSSISEKLPGLHLVDNCSNVNRRHLEIDRRLDRIECRVTQYREKDRTLFPVAMVVQQAAAVLERWSAHIVGINVSVTGFCSREVVTEDFATFDWPETLGGTNASFLCQNNNSVTRMCRVGGIWEKFDPEGCNTDYCAVEGTEGYNCLSEKLCVPQNYICDGIPDCVRATLAIDEMDCLPTPDDCIHGEVRTPLLGGATEREGLVEVCVIGSYLPVVLDSGRFSVREATAICRQLKLGNAGIPLNFHSFFGTENKLLSHVVKVRCDREVDSLSACILSVINSNTVTESQAAVRCIQTQSESCRDKEIRLVNDASIDEESFQSPNEGRVEICFNNVWGAIYDTNWTNKDAAVACHQLGFSRYRAIPTTLEYYGNADLVPFVLSGPLCNGNETSLFQCRNVSNLPFGKTDKYRGEPDDMRNTAGVRCESHENGSCLHLETRLVFRTAPSSGIVEICNEEGTWSIACAESTDEHEANVICMQLGYMSGITNYFSQSVSLLDTRQKFTGQLNCSGNEASLHNCVTSPTMIPIVRRSVPLCNAQAYLQCGATPMTYIHPRRSNVVEQQRHRMFSCSWNQDIYPPVTTLITSRTSGKSIIRGNSSSLALASIQIVNASFEDNDEYLCTAVSSLGRSDDSINITVRVPEGLNESAYIRVSHLSFERILNTISDSVTDKTQVLDQLNFQEHILSSINEDIPGLHIVDRCINVSRPQFETDRRLDRSECRITQYWNETEIVMPLFRVLQKATAFLEHVFAPLVVRVDVSATGFCSRETITIEDTHFEWQETVGGENASFQCPNRADMVVMRLCEVGGQWKEFDETLCANTSFCRSEIVQTEGSTYLWPETPRDGIASISCPSNPEFSVTRQCSIGGVWQPFDEEVCGVVIQLLSRLNNSFTNLSNVIYEESVSVLAQAIERSENSTVEQNREVLDTVADYSAELAAFVSNSEIMINNTVIGEMVRVVSSLLQWDPANIISASSSSVLQSFEEVVSTYAQQLFMNEEQTFTAPSLVVVAELRSINSFVEEGRSFIINGSEPLLLSNNQMTPGLLPLQQNAAISLPQSLFRMINNSDDIGVFFGVYEMATLFPVGKANTASDPARQLQVCSNVVAATVGQNISIQNLEEPVTVVLRLQTKQRMFTALGTERCVTWDFSIQDWTAQGCNTSITQNETIICQCNHLTNFAVLVEVCSRPEDCQNSINQQLNRLNGSFNNLNAETYEAAVSMLSQVVERSQTREDEQTSEVLGTIAGYFTQLATFVNNTMPNINTSTIDDIVQVVSTLLQWEPANVVAASSSSVIQSFEVVVSLYAQQLSLNERQNFTSTSIILVAELRSIESLSISGRSFAIGDGDSEAVLAAGDAVKAGQLLPDQTAAIRLPASLFQQIDNRSTVGIFFALYNTSVLFPVDAGSTIDIDVRRRTEVGSHVLAATVGPGLIFQNLPEPVTLVLQVQIAEGQFMQAGSEVCVSWNFTLQDWTPEGCTTITGQDGIVTCSCNHLTNFAVLVDVCLRQEDCESNSLDSVFADTLTFVSYIGMIISIICLVLAIITLLAFKKLREKDASKYHIQLCLAILLMLAVSLVLVGLSAEDVVALYGGCVTVSIFIHYFTLVAVLWMGAEALLMFQKLVIIFTRITTKFIISVSVICWTLPLIFVFIPFIVDLANGRDSGSDIVIHRANTTTEEISFCFLSHPGAFWGAFLVPILAIMVFNVIIFIWVIVVLIRHTRGTAARTKEAVSTKTIVRLMISIGGVMFLFGLTWLFAILTFSAAPGFRETFQALFTVSNSFQGFFIFLFFCVFSKEAREHWKEVLSFGTYSSEFLHPSQTKHISSSGTGGKKSKNTTSIGTNTSSVEKSSYALETISKNINIYESSMTVKQGEAPDIEKIPLDCECPKGSSETVSEDETNINSNKDTTVAIEAADKEEPQQSNATVGNDSETTVVVVADTETQAGEDSEAIQDNIGHQSTDFEVSIKAASEDGGHDSDKPTAAIETSFNETAAKAGDADKKKEDERKEE